MRSSSAAVIFGHAGGWDEALIVLAPMLVFFGLLFLANRKAKREEMDEETEGRLPERD